jgi:hypothetical protein
MGLSFVVVKVFHHRDTEDSEKKKTEERRTGPQRNLGACVPKGSLGTIKNGILARSDKE